MDLSKLKSKTFSVDKLVQAAQDADSNGGGGRDERFWQPQVDQAGNGYAIIRFLPAPDSDVPWARYWSHGFKGPTGKWYIENSLTSIGQTDPVGEMNSELWGTGTKENQDLVRQRKRKLHYVSNILVLNDASNPENNGKVFMYRYGKKIFDKLMDLMQPEFPDEKPVNPFDLDDGADFVLKIRKVEGYRNYDKSEFRPASALFDGDETKQGQVAENLYELSEFTDPSKYKSYEELAAKLASVLGERYKQPSQKQQEALEQTQEPQQPREATQPEIPQSVEEVVQGDVAADDDEDDTMSYFQKLAQGD